MGKTPKAGEEEDYILGLLEKSMVAYAKDFMKRVGVKVNTEEAENVVSKVGTRILKRRLNLKA